MMSAPPRKRRRGDQVWRRVRLPGEQIPGAAPGADLQQFPAKNVLERLAQQLRLGCEQRRARAAIATRR